MPRPAIADSRCSTVETLTPFAVSVVDSVVSPTFSGQAFMQTGSGSIHAPEHHAVVDRRRTQGQVHLLASV